MGLGGFRVAHEVQQVGAEEGGRDRADHHPADQPQVDRPGAEVDERADRAHHERGDEVAGDRGRRRDPEQQDQHRRHQGAAAGAGHADEQADDRAAENDVRVDVHGSRAVPTPSASTRLRPRLVERVSRRPATSVSRGPAPRAAGARRAACRATASLRPCGRTRPRRERSESALVTVGRRAATRSASTVWVRRSGRMTPSARTRPHRPAKCQNSMCRRSSTRAWWMIAMLTTRRRERRTARSNRRPASSG